MDEIHDRVPTTSNQAKGVKEDPLASRSLAKKPHGKRQREGMSALHEGGALESPHSTSQPMKKPKLSKHPISVARAGEDLAARSSKVLVPASRPLREEMSALHDRTVVGSPGSTLQLLKLHMLGETLFDKRQLQCSLTSQQREQCVTLLFIFIIIIDILKSIDLPC